MKKTLLALAVVAAAGSVNAAELMSSGNISVTAQSEFEVAYVINEANGNSGISYDNAELGFSAESVINDNWTAFLNYGLEMVYGGDVVSTDIVAGFKFYNNHQVEFGKTDHAVDLGSNESKNIGAFFGQDDLPSVEDIIVYTYSGENFSAGISHEFDLGTDDETTSTAGNIEATFGGLTLRGDVGFGKDDANMDESTVYGVKASYTADVFKVGSAYSASTTEDTITGDKSDISVIDGWIGFSAGLDWIAGVQYAESGDADAIAYYVNTSYSLNDVVSIYAEVGALDTDARTVDLTDPGFGASLGMVMAF